MIHGSLDLNVVIFDTWDMCGVAYSKPITPNIKLHNITLLSSHVAENSLSFTRCELKHTYVSQYTSLKWDGNIIQLHLQVNILP